MHGGFILGEAIGWSSSAFYINRSVDDPHQGIIHHMPYIGALMPLGAILVMPFLSVSLDHIGRKLAMLCMAPMCAVSFVIPGIIQNHICWMVVRLLMGFSCAGFSVAAPIFVAEIAQKEIRGTLGAMFQLLLTVGICYAYLLGLGRNMLLFAILGSLVPCAFFICFLFFPESPLFLLRKGKEDAAIKSMQWYRGKDYNITTEFLEVKAYYEEIKILKATPKDLISTKAARRSLIVALGLAMFQQLSGISVVTFYATEIFTHAGTTIDPIVCSIILGVVEMIATLVATLLVDKLGRKVLLHVSLTGMAICLLALSGWYIYMGDNTPSKTLRVLPVLIISLYMVFFSLGVGPVPWLMIGEIFPKHIKGMSGSLTGFLLHSLACLVTATFDPMIRAMGLSPPFFMYGIISILGNVFVFYIVIETKGKTLEEIQEEMGS